MSQPCYGLARLTAASFGLESSFTDFRISLFLFPSLSLFPQSEVAEQRSLAETYRAQLLSLEAEMDTLREVSAASKEMLKVI